MSPSGVGGARADVWASQQPHGAVPACLCWWLSSSGGHGTGPAWCYEDMQTSVQSWPLVYTGSLGGTQVSMSWKLFQAEGRACLLMPLSLVTHQPRNVLSDGLQHRGPRPSNARSQQGLERVPVEP